MPRDSNGVFSLVAGYLAVTGETVLASQHNPPLEDIAAALTGSLPTSGAAPMTAPLKLPDGTVTAPALTLASATSWGFYKTATGWGIAVSGANVADFTPTALALPNGLTVAKTTTFKDAGDVASAGALSLGDGNIFNITGTTSITSIATKGVGTIVWLRFAAALTLTHHTTDLVLANSANITTAPGDWAVFEEYATGDWRLVSYHRIAGTALQASLPRGYIDGCTIANGTDATNDINFSAGVCRDSSNTVDITCAAMVKQLDANWAAGTNQGMREATGISDTTFHLFAIAKADGTQDWFAYTTTNPSAVLPTDYLYYRLVASIVRTGAAIKPFKQINDWFYWVTPALDVSNATPGTNRVTKALTVPTGLKLLVRMQGGAAGGNGVSVMAVDVTDTAPVFNDNALATFGFNQAGSSAGQFEVFTDTSAQIVYRCTANQAVQMTTHAFQHPRGRDA